MAEQPKSIDLSDVPDILRLVKRCVASASLASCAGMGKTWRWLCRSRVPGRLASRNRLAKTLRRSVVLPGVEQMSILTN